MTKSELRVGLVLMGLAGLGGCVWSEVPKDAVYACAADGSCGDGLTCRAGYCVPAPGDSGTAADSGPKDSGTPDSGKPDSGTPDAGTPDSGTPDSGTPDSGTPDACTPITCAQAGAECGPISNGCGAVIQCPACTSPKSCAGGPDGGMANICGCTPFAPSVVCAIAGKSCGNITAPNGCGAMGSFTCGAACPVDAGCVGETAAELCTKAKHTCGTLGGKDRCGVARLVNCGACSSGNVCYVGDDPADGGPAAQCVVCTPEGASTLCERNGANCGPLTAQDNCGVSRSVNCGPDPCLVELDDGGTGQSACGIAGGHMANQCACQPLFAGCQVGAQCCTGTCSPSNTCCIAQGNTCNDDADCCGTLSCTGRPDGGASCMP